MIGPMLSIFLISILGGLSLGCQTSLMKSSENVGEAQGFDDDEASDLVENADFETDSGVDAGDTLVTFYPEGPYSFKSSMRWNDLEGSGAWTSSGGIVPNICLDNVIGNEVCLGDFYQDGEYSLLFVSFVSTSCPYSMFAASSSSKFTKFLKKNGWNVLWITILEEDALQSSIDQPEANLWGLDAGIDLEFVLYDPTGQWQASALEESGGFPTTYVVHTSNMLIWDYFVGWVDPSGQYWDKFLEWWPEFLNYCSNQEKSIIN